MKNCGSKIIISVSILAVSLVSIGLGGFFYIQNIINRPYNIQDNTAREFIIKEGEKVKQISANLEKEELISGKDFFEIYVWQERVASRIQAGNYELSSSMTIPEIVDIFIAGEVKSDDIYITIPEGFSNKEIDKRLAEKGLILEGEFLDFDKKQDVDSSEYEFLQDKPKEAGLQGYYFPDTYIYYKNSSLKDIAKKMLDNFDRKLSLELKEETKKQNKSVFETIILASIIEKEAKFPEDMKKISNVFQNRLNAGQKLQSDATINYITGSGRTQSTFEDLQIDSPFNTYKYAGLPPGPISNPGIAAIEAAVYQEKTDYFYFLTKSDGKAIFSKTYNEHLKNKSKYLQ